MITYRKPLVEQTQHFLLALNGKIGKPTDWQVPTSTANADKSD